MKKSKMMIFVFIITLSIIIFDRKVFKEEMIDVNKGAENVLEADIEANLEKGDEIKSKNENVEDLNSEEIMSQTEIDEKEEIQDTSSNFDIEKKNDSEKEKNNKAKISTNQKKSNKSQNKTNSNSSTSTSLSEKKEVTVNGSDDKHYISEGQWYTVSDWFSIEE